MIPDVIRHNLRDNLETIIADDAKNSSVVFMFSEAGKPCAFLHGDYTKVAGWITDFLGMYPELEAMVAIKIAYKLSNESL